MDDATGCNLFDFTCLTTDSDMLKTCSVSSFRSYVTSVILNLNVVTDGNAT